jgi:hypothetical protein
MAATAAEQRSITVHMRLSTRTVLVLHVPGKQSQYLQLMLVNAACSPVPLLLLQAF